MYGLNISIIWKNTMLHDVGEIYKDNNIIHALLIEIVCGVSKYIFTCVF
jgi:hypothetical protein